MGCYECDSLDAGLGEGEKKFDGGFKVCGTGAVRRSKRRQSGSMPNSPTGSPRIGICGVKWVRRHSLRS